MRLLLKFLPDRPNIPWMKWRRYLVALSAILTIGSLALLATRGLNFGVDFRGGTTIEVVDDKAIDLAQVRSAVGGLGLGETTVQRIRDFAGSQEGVVVFVERQEAPPGTSEIDANKLQQAAAEKIQNALRSALGEGIEFRRIDVVGPTVSGELVRTGFLAVGLSIALMLVYIWFRFEWQFGVATVLALLHDSIVALGLLSLTGYEFSVASIAAILTIIGYSVNDTVVVFDRVRENLRKYKQKSIEEVLDLSINETLARTIMTSGTTLMALIVLVIFGGEVLRGFTMAIIFGIIVGTYSSIFVGAPFVMATGVKRDWAKVKMAAPATP
jgi:preprotein translocase SecF subunit